MKIAEKQIEEIGHELPEIGDFSDMVTLFQNSLNQIIPIDWMAVATSFAYGERINVTSNPHLPFNWDELYQQIAPIDNYAKYVVSLPPGNPVIYEEFRDPSSEIERYCCEFAKHYTDTVHMMVMACVKDEEGLAIMGLYRTDVRREFQHEEKKMLIGIAPLICSSIKMMMLKKRLELKHTAYESLFANSDLRPVLLDQRLRIIDFPLNTLGFLREMFHDPSLEGLPVPIQKSISAHIAPKEVVPPCSGPWQFRVSAVRGDIVCRAYVLANDKKHPVLILKFDPHGATEDFSCLAGAGITPRKLKRCRICPWDIRTDKSPPRWKLPPME